MDDDGIEVDRRRYSRVPLTRNVNFTVVMRTEIETLQGAPTLESRPPTYEISATVNVHQASSAKPVRYDLTATLKPHESSEREHDATTKNLSHGGVCIVTPFALQENQVVRIGLPVPESQVTTPTLAEVRWLKSDDGMVRAGLRYLL